MTSDHTRTTRGPDPDDPLAFVPAALWRSVATAPHRSLMLDYDGTLAPFHIERHEARPTPETLALLRALAGADHTDLAIVSGRPVGELERLLGPLPVMLVGEHGWETRGPGGRRLLARLGDPERDALARAAELASSRGWGVHIERKRSAIVLHTRGLPPDDAAVIEVSCRTLWSEVSRSARLRLDRISGGLELRATDHDKGVAVRALLASAPAGTLAVFVGDDLTDEDAFAAVADRGFGVRVGGDTGSGHAGARLPGCEAVTRFLSEWLSVVEQGAPRVFPPGGAT